MESVELTWEFSQFEMVMFWKEKWQINMLERVSWFLSYSLQTTGIITQALILLLLKSINISFVAVWKHWKTGLKKKIKTILKKKNKNK